MVGESIQNVFLIQKDVWIFAEFEISEFEISRFDCMSIASMENNKEVLHPAKAAVLCHIVFLIFLIKA